MGGRARPDGSTALIVADVSGHGAEAGLVALRFKQRITALLDTDLDLASAFQIAARRPDDDVERFLSCLVVVVDPRAGGWPGSTPATRRRWSVDRATHPRQRRRAAPDRPADQLGHRRLGRGAGTLFGRRDMLLACTDGVLEARDDSGDEFGTDGLLGVLRGLRRWSPEEAVAECGEAVRQFAADVRRDDVTCVALALAPGRQPG